MQQYGSGSRHSRCQSHFRELQTTNIHDKSMIRGPSTAVASNVTDWEGRYVSRIIDIWIVIVGGDQVV